MKTNPVISVVLLACILLNLSIIAGSCVTNSNASEQTESVEKSLLKSTDMLSVKEVSDQTTTGFETSQKHLRSLKDAYKNYFPVGAAIRSDTFLSPERLAFIKSQFSSVTVRTGLQPAVIQPREGSFKWARVDPLVNFAQENNIKVRGHVLIFNIHAPKWFFEDGNREASRELVLKRMKDHITTIMTRYKGKIYCWDVVNEAILAKKTFFFPQDKFIQIVGEDYIEQAFRYARKADPSAKLFYNDGVYTEAKRDALYGFLKKLKAKGVPIDGVGIQCHLGKTGLPNGFLQSCIDKFSSLGLEIQITELDVSIYDKYGKKDIDKLARLSDEYSDEVQEQQSRTFDNIFSVCRNNKGKVTGITLWGDADGINSSFEKLMKKKNYQLLFDRDMKPKEKVLRRVVEF